MSEIINAHIPYGGGKQRPTEIIVHCMAENIQNENNPEVYDHAVAFLNEYKLSAHALIAPNGDIYRCRFDEEQAWHARGHNKNTLGIEFLVQGDHNYGSFVENINLKGEIVDYYYWNKNKNILTEISTLPQHAETT